MEVVDANVFIRYVARDDEDKADRAFAFLDALADEPVRAITTEAILAEVVFILNSKRHYAIPRARIVDELKAIIDLAGLSIDHPATMHRALDLYDSSPIDFPDALVIAHAERIGADAIVAFDTDYDRFSTISRREP